MALSARESAADSASAAVAMSVIKLVRQIFAPNRISISLIVLSFFTTFYD